MPPRKISNQNTQEKKRKEPESINKLPKEKVLKPTPIEEPVEEQISLDTTPPPTPQPLETKPRSPKKYANPIVDFSFKKLFATETNKNLLISFLNATLNLHIREISLKNPFSQRSEEDKLSILDVFCQDEKKNQFIVEVQRAKLTGFEKRIQYYGSKYYSDQIGVGEDYTTLLPVYLVILVDFKMFEKDIECVSHHETREIKTGRNLLKDIKYTIIELPKFKFPEHPTIQDQWLNLLTNYEEGPPKDSAKEVSDAYDILEMSKWKVEDKIEYERRVLEEGEQKQKLDYAKQEGMQEGIEIGRQEGIDIGVERGIERGIEESIRTIYQNGNQNILMLADWFKKDVNEVKRILGL